MLSGSTLYVGGWFNRIGGEYRNYVAALDTQTGTPTAWNPGADKAVYALASTARPSISAENLPHSPNRTESDWLP